MNSNRQSVERFMRHWSQYCDRHHLESPFGLEIAANIRGGRVAPMAEFTNIRPPEDIMRLLRGSGLPF